MQLHVCLKSDVAAFSFVEHDLAPLQERFPEIDLRCHADHDSLLANAADADCLLTWEFRADWYPSFPRLRTIMTPAAGHDWVAVDPDGRVEMIHGTFHGRLLGESVLGAVLFMNHRMPAMIGNFRRREWDRNIQQDCRILASQTVLVIGLGHIGSECARLMQPLGPRLIGVKRDPSRLVQPLPGVEVRGVDELDGLLPEADHILVVLPGAAGTDRVLDAGRLRQCKPGACVYNFGRGNAIASEDLVAAADHIGGAFLDVTDEEPLPPDSPLWTLDNIMITPHSSCIYREYRERFIAEVIGHLEKK